VTVAVPVRNEATRLDACLRAINAQDYDGDIEILVVDGRSDDGTLALAEATPGVVVLDNPEQRRPVGRNIALQRASGEIFVVVDARTRIAADYVRRCVVALQTSGAFVVGGPMRCVGAGWFGRGVARAMQSRLGAGPAAYRRAVGHARMVDTVYLGAFWTAELRDAGGFTETGAAADAEISWRAQRRGGAYLDPEISSVYLVRERPSELWRHWARYGRIRAQMVQETGAIQPRQLAAPLLLLALVSPRRRGALMLYLSGVAARAVLEIDDPPAALGFAFALPIMHLSWGIGFLSRLLKPSGRRRAIKDNGDLRNTAHTEPSSAAP
jgi:cellulose synthase/poly-beta-1,6-N-acetylglucosamine synthase-like glycosyltransferase